MKTTDKHVFFYSEWPSNFTGTSFTWKAFRECHSFFCTEQAFMWAKAKYFGDEEAAEDILVPESEGNTPAQCKRRGRLVEGYDDSRWSLVRYGFMYDVNMCKYTQDKDLQAKLLDPQFDGKTFVEASPTDKIWGIGLSQDQADDDESRWNGQNLLGKAITQVRSSIKQSLQHESSTAASAGMTVKQLLDALDNYIKRDPPGMWQLNDCGADAAAYNERCIERGSREVIILDDGMQPKHFAVASAFGTTLCPMQSDGSFSTREVLALCTDLSNEVK